MRARGRCWKFGDNIPTDQIVRSDRALASMAEMRAHVLENLNPAFARDVRPGDILVAGRHFGQSSGRAIAPKALAATGIGAVVVEYAARLFYRNCFEIGLPLLSARASPRRWPTATCWRSTSRSASSSWNGPAPASRVSPPTRSC